MGTCRASRPKMKTSPLHRDPTSELMQNVARGSARGNASNVSIAQLVASCAT
jgi:hypothetical protein